MEDKNKFSGVISPGDASGQGSSSVSVDPNLSFDPQALSNQPVAFSPISPAVQASHWYSKAWLRWGALAGVALLLVAGIGFVLTRAVNNNDKAGISNVATGFETTVVPLDGFDVGPIVNLNNTKTVMINGTLTVRDGLVIGPTVQPATAQPGQIYYDVNENTLAYFNGVEFVSVGGNVVQEIQDLTGNIALGAGLSNTGGQLANSGVLSVQGQTGNVTFAAGSGITLNGTTITNSGVVSVASSSPSITVSNDGNGNITLGGSGSGTVSSVGGTAGRLAKFTGAQSIADSLLGESGTVVTVNGDLTVTGALSLSVGLPVTSGGTGATSLGANGVLVGNGTGAITSVVAGAAGLCLASTGGAPVWASCNPASSAVNSLNGLTGTLTIANATGLVNTITIDDASTSNKGIAQFNNTNFNVSGGNVNTAQNISTASSPTFNTLTLSGNLTVQGGTSTLGTVTQAGSIVLSDGSSHTVTIVADNLSNNRIYTLPDAGGDATLCVTAGNCIGGGGSAPNTADYLVASLNGTLTNERALASGSNISLTDGGANGNFTVATVQNPTFTTSVTTPVLQSSGALVISSAAGNTVAVNAATTIELQDSTNVTGTLDVSVALNVGTSDAFAVSSGGAITAAAGITSSGTIVFSGLNCTGNANGGALTTNGSGQLVCSDDDGGAGGGISGSGTSGTVPLFNGATSITNSIITQSGSTISIAGDLTLTTDLTVANGGTGASSFTSNGVLYGGGSGALQVTAAGTSGQVLVANGSGVPTFVSFTGDVTVSNAGVTAIQPNSVALGTDTAGDYVSSLGALTGLNTSGNSGEGSTPTLSVSYGSIANTAVQGNVTLTCPSGTGNLTGGGTSITLGTGGSCANLNTVNNPSFTTSVTTPNLILTGAGNNGSIVLDNLGQGTIYTLPDPNQAAVDICLSIGNCGTAGTAGGDLTGTYPNPTIASFQGTDVDISSPLAGHILVWNGTNSAWENHAVSSDIAINETGVATIQSNAVALGGDTTGNYVIGLTAGNGISLGGSAGEGWSPSVAVIYGSSANTAVQGNTGITVTAGTNLTGGGGITLGAGGTVTLNVASSPIFSGTLTVQGTTATVGTTSVQGGVVIHDGAGETGTIQTDASLGQSVTYTLPDPGQATVDICVSTGNCAGAGSGVTGSGTTNRLSKFTGSQAIGDSLVSDDGSIVTITGSGNFVVQGGTATLGTLSQAGTLSVSDGSNHTISIVAAGVANNRTFTLPETGGPADFCMSSGNCIGGGGGGAPNTATYLLASLDGTLTNDRALTSGSNIAFTDGGANGNFTVATVQNPTFTTSVTTPQLQSSGALVISSGSGTVAVNATTTIELQDSTNVTGVLDVSASLNVGTSDAFAVSSGGAITAATGVTSSGTITFGGLDCTTFANGGSVTTDSSGVLSCSDDNGAAANTITGSGTNGTIALFNGTNSIGDSVMTQSGSVVTITGSLTLTTDLTVANGGTGASSFTSNGVLYGGGSGALQVTAAGTSGQVLVANGSGVPTFVSFTGDVNVSNAGVTAIQPNSVALGTDTTGDYVANLGTMTGLTVGSNSGEGSAPTLSVNYGSGANTAVQGNTTLTCPSGTGNLTGGGTSITLGTGGSCANLNTINNPSFTTSVTTPNLIMTGAGSNGSILLDNLGQAATFTLPDPNQATADICISTGNCTAVGTAGGDLTGSYPSPTIAKLQGSTLTINTVASGNILQYNGSAWVNQSISGDVVLNNSAVATIQANSVALTTDTTGDYVANLGSATGITIGSNSGEGSAPTLSVNYGSSANTAVQGNVTLTCPSGTGNLSGGGTSITLGTGGTCGNISITNSPTFTGTLTVNTIDATSAMTIGDIAQTLTLQGNATTELTATDSGNTTTVGFATPTADIDILFPALASGGPYTVCTSSGNCGGVGATLQTAYTNSTGGVTAEILLDSTRNAVTIRDNSTPIVGNLFEVENNTASTTYFAVTSAGTETTGTIISSGNINTTGGGINTGGGAGTQRIDNSGNLINIGNLTATGAITIASTTGSNDIILNSADTIELQDATNVTGALSASGTITLGTLGTTDTATYMCRNTTNRLAACNTTGTGAAFVQGGNSFGATAVLGTNDAFGLELRTGVGGNTRLSVGSGGGINIARNDTADELEIGDDIFTLNDSNTRLNLGNTANDTYMRLGESSLLFGFMGWLNSTNTMRVGTFGANDLRLETNSSIRMTATGAGVVNFDTVASSGVAGFSVNTTQNTTTGLQPGNSLATTVNPGGTASASYFGNQMLVNIGAAGTTFTGDIVANLGQVNWSGATNTSNTGKLYGTIGKVVTASGSGSVQNAVGLFSQLQYAGGTTVTNSYNMYASNLQSGATTNLYGFYAENMTGGTNNYPLYLASATQGQPLLSVNGTGATNLRNSTNSASAFQIQNASGVSGLNVDTTTPNLMTNHSFETDTSGWAAKGAATLSRVTTQYYDNTASLQAATTAASGDGATHAYSLASSTQYTFSVFVKASVGGFNAFEIGRSENGVADISCGTNLQAFSTHFARYSCTFTTGTVSGSPYLYIKQIDTNARNTWIDAVQLETAASATLYRNSKVTLAGSLAINSGTSPVGNTDVALRVTAPSGGDGFHLTGAGSGSVFKNILLITEADGSTLMSINDASRGTTIQGGHSFFGNSALTTVSVDAGVAALEAQGAAGQTADVFKIQNSSDVNMFTVGASGAVLSKNTTNSTSAFQVQNASSQNLFNVDTTNKALTASSAAAASLFATKVDYTTANAPLGAATADFDKDGDMDMAVANTGSTSVSVFMNNGSGTFATKVDYTTATNPRYVATADFDKDGDMDMAVTNGGSNSVSVFMNNGSGVFAAKVDYTTATNPRNIIATDFDKDGDMDMATTNFGSTNFSVFINNGSGVFAAKVDYTTGVTPFGITSGDFDRDGDNDVAVANNDSDSISIFMNSGTGTFAAKVDYDAFSSTIFGENPNGLVSADFDKDGDIDLATVNDASESLAILFNAGNGTFGTAAEYVTGATPRNLVTIDIDKDGDMDLLVTNEGPDTVSLLKNNGNGTFATRVDFGTGINPYSVIAADFDKDGDMDVAATNGGTTSISVLLNVTLGVSPLATPTLTLYSGGVNDSLQIKSSDDRRLFSVDARGNTTIGEQSDSEGTLFAGHQEFLTGAHPYGITSADFDKDGDMDLAVVVLSDNAISILLNKGNGTFATHVDYPVAGTPISATVGDFDKDGDIDLVVTNEGSDSVSILMNNGNGTFATKVDYTVGDQPEGLIATDLDKDGDIDLAVANSNADTVSILKNNGAGTFAAKVDYTVGQDPYYVSFADFDKDGDIDLVTANQTTNNASVLMNSGTGTFAAKVDYAAASGSTAVKTADFDKDGDIDFAVGNDDSVSVFMNNGNGTFAADVEYTVSNAQDMAVADFDKDGNVDIAVVNDDSPSYATLLINNGNGTFASAVDYWVGFFPIAIIAADFDKDGDMDIATANESSDTDTTSVLLNNTISNSRFKILSGDASATIFSINATGSAAFRTSANSANAFQVLSSNGTSLFNIDSASSNPNNLVTNASFEAGTGGWDSIIACSLSAAGEAYSGERSGRCSVSAGFASGMQFDLSTTTLTSSTTYTMSFYAKAASGSFSTFEFGRSDNGSTETACMTAQTVTSGGWKRFDCTFTTGTTSGTPFVYMKQTDTTARVWYVDAVLVQASANAETTYREGKVTLNSMIGSQVTIQNSQNSTNAFEVNNANGNSVFSIDTSGGNQNNLIANPSFETNTTGWAAKGTPTTFARDATERYSGNASLKFTTQASANQGARYNVTLADSSAYAVSFYAKIDAATDEGVYGESIIAGYSSDGSTDTNATCGMEAPFAINSNRWQIVRCTFITPSSHSGTPFFYIKRSSASIATYYIDAVLLQTDANADSNYREGKINLQGIISSPLIVQSSTNSSTAFSVQNDKGTDIIAVNQGTYYGWGTNIITNPDFETNTTGWTAVGTGAVIQRDTVRSMTGHSSLKVTTGAVADSGVKFVTGANGPTAFSWGEDHHISFFVRTASGTMTDLAMAYSYDGNAASESGDSCATFTATTSWTRVECEVDSVNGPADTDAYVIIKQETSTSSQTFYIDGVIVSTGYDGAGVGYGAASITLNGVIVSPTIFRHTDETNMAFAIQNPYGASLLRVDTVNQRLYVGDPDTSGYSTVLVLDDSSSAPTNGAINGAMYYNTTDNKFRCYQNSIWVNCLNGLNDAVTVEDVENGSFTATNTTWGVTTTGGTYADTATTFIVPPSGKVMIHYEGQLQNGTANMWVAISPEVRTGGVIGSGTVVNAAQGEESCQVENATAGSSYRAGCFMLLTGLTVGSTYNVRLLHNMEGGTATIFRRQVVVEPVW